MFPESSFCEHLFHLLGRALASTRAAYLSHQAVLVVVDSTRSPLNPTQIASHGRATLTLAQRRWKCLVL